VLKDTPIAKTFAEFGNFPLIFDLEPKATAEINRLADVRRDVPLAALEERMKKARMNITGPSVFDNPADVADLTAPKVRSDNSFNPDTGMEDILAQAEPFISLSGGKLLKTCQTMDRPEVSGRMIEAWRISGRAFRISRQYLSQYLVWRRKTQSGETQVGNHRSKQLQQQSLMVVSKNPIQMLMTQGLPVASVPCHHMRVS
jgi:hypothetical protein